MAPNSKSLKILTGPTVVANGVVGRVVSLPDGGARVETWRPGSGWVVGGAFFDEFIMGRPVSADLAKRLGIPASELASNESTKQPLQTPPGATEVGPEQSGTGFVLPTDNPSLRKRR